MKLEKAKSKLLLLSIFMIMIFGFQNCNGPESTTDSSNSSSTNTGINDITLGPEPDQTLESQPGTQTDANGDPYSGGGGQAPLPPYYTDDPDQAAEIYGHFNARGSVANCGSVDQDTTHPYSQTETHLVYEDPSFFAVVDNCEDNTEYFSDTANAVTKFSAWHYIVSGKIFDIIPVDNNVNQQYTFVLCSTRLVNHTRASEKEAIIWHTADEDLSLRHVNENANNEVSQFDHSISSLSLQNNLLTISANNNIHTYEVDLSVAPDSNNLYSAEYTRLNTDGSLRQKRDFKCYVNTSLVDEYLSQ